MEELDNDQQSQPQLEVPSTIQTAYSTTTPVHHHDQVNKVLAAPRNASIKDEANRGDFIDYKEFFDSLPPGYRFRPTKEELVLYYLLPKISKQPLPPNHIRDVDLYEHSPDKITERYPTEENEWYFFTPRNRKYPNGDRPNRATGNDGFWKATGADVTIKDKGRTVGYKKSLVFHKGRAPNGQKTNWIMHEYRANDNDSPKHKKGTNMRLDDYVLCRIHKKNDKVLKGRQNEEVQDAGTATCVNDYNNTEVFDSSRLMNSFDDKDLTDASSGPVKFAGHFPVAGVTPPNFGLFSADQNMNLSTQQEDDTAYRPSELDFWYPPKFENDFEATLPDIESFFDR